MWRRNHPYQTRYAEARRSSFVAVTRVHMTAQVYREPFDSVSNWGRRDDDGQRGALSHLTPARMATARRVDSGATVTLGRPLRTRDWRAV
jgi:hypothetical protein